MLDNYIIEIRPKSAGITVRAGIVVRDGSHFRFYAATHAFNSLEGRLFESPECGGIGGVSSYSRHVNAQPLRQH